MTFDDMTRKERVKLIIEDSQAYIDLVPSELFLGILDGIAKIGPIESLHDESNAAS